MLNKKSFIDYFTIGFALFAVFFGAGNLIFPPAIGLQSGTAWVSAISGMTVSAILLPILTVIAVNNMGSDLDDLSKPVASWFYFLYTVLFVLFVGLVGVPRQGAVGIETGLFSIFPSLQGSRMALFVGLLIYFTLVFVLTRKPYRIVDIVGQFLTPVLLVILLFIVVMAFVRPIGVPGDTGITNSFSNAFLEGYQTGDVVIGIFVSGVFLASIRDKGYRDKKAINDITVKGAVIAFLGLLIVYSGLLYLGASGTALFQEGIDETLLLTSSVRLLVGNAGLTALGVCVFLACLTTSIGVVTSIANTVRKLSKNKIPYQVIVACCCITGITIGTIGVSSILAYSYPSFLLLYPVSIVLTLLGLFRKYVPNHGAWKGAVVMSAITGLYDALASMVEMGVLNVDISALTRLYNTIPFASAGFSWFVPAAIGFAVGALIVKFSGGAPYPMLEDEATAVLSGEEPSGYDLKTGVPLKEK